MQIEESSNMGKPLIALKRIFDDCAADDNAGILLSKRDMPIIEFGMWAMEAIENSESVLLLLLLS